MKQVDDTDQRIIRALCGDIGEDRRPFAHVAEAIGCTEQDLLARLNAFTHSGMLRRFGAVLRHQSAGFTANGMSAWNVPDHAVEKVGRTLAACPEVTHCYERPRIPDWPYNIYAMIHGRTEQECRAVVTRMAEETGITDHTILFSRREFKKSSVIYFAESTEPNA